jgi:gamma-glutamyltranspeptidase/glutathione hydrolase
MDAAIAANAALGVVEPQSCGIGGDLFAIYRDGKTGQLTGINASGWAPKALTIDELKGMGHTTAMPKDGIQTVTAPGCVNGWARLHKRFGRLPWKDLFQPAIYYATQGFAVTEIIAEAWKAQSLKTKLGKDANARQVYMPNGKTPDTGEVFRESDSQDERPTGRQDGGGGPGGVRGGVGAADFDRLPGLEDL